jgi:hypothetical protein
MDAGRPVKDDKMEKAVVDKVNEYRTTTAIVGASVDLVMLKEKEREKVYGFGTNRKMTTSRVTQSTLLTVNTYFPNGWFDSEFWNNRSRVVVPGTTTTTRWHKFCDSKQFPVSSIRDVSRGESFFLGKDPV